MKALNIGQFMGEKAHVVSLGELMSRVASLEGAKWKDLPDCPGVYIVCLPGWEERSICANSGQAKHAKSADPASLKKKRNRIIEIATTDILYIGKSGGTSSNLRIRVSTLARFGMGRTKTHRGGEWLWQVNGIEDAQMHMWCCQRGKPEGIERDLINRFLVEHGELPLANRI